MRRSEARPLSGESGPAPENRRIVRDRVLREWHLSALLKDEVIAIVISKFTDEIACEVMSARILESDLIEPYTHELKRDGVFVQEYLGVDRLGIPFNSTYGHQSGSPEKKAYYNQLAHQQSQISKLALPHPSPIARLFHQLQKVHRDGIETARFEGQPMLVGIVRIAKPEFSHLGAAQPHFDALPETYGVLDAQIAANIYLRTNSIGGYLELWDVPPLDPCFVVPPDWRAGLPSSIKIMPQTGDLILFNCRKPHTIGAFSDACRISLQMFIGKQNGKPLFAWN